MKMTAKEREYHRKVAKGSFNHAWDLLDKKKRSSEEELQMLLLAHVSRYHWGLIGTPKNRAIAEWQLSRVYTELGQPDLALRFAKECLATCRESGLSEIMHTANEAIARAYAVGRDYRRARRHLAVARRQLDRLSLNKADRDVYLSQLKDTEALIRVG